MLKGDHKESLASNKRIDSLILFMNNRISLTKVFFSLNLGEGNLDDSYKATVIIREEEEKAGGLQNLLAKLYKHAY